MSDYFKVDAISQSALTNFSYGPQYYRSKQKVEIEPSDALIIGSAVDILITEKEQFNKLFHISDLSKPTGQLGEFIEHYINTGSLKEAYFLTDYKRKKDSLEAITNKFNEEGLDYYNAFINSKDKQLLTKEQYNTVTAVAKSLLTNKFTEKYFNNDKEKIYQLEVYWEYKGIKLKSKFDLILIDHKAKTIELIDIKTTGFHTSQFTKSFLKFRYDLQASFYTYAADYYFNEQYPLEDYAIKSFKFIVESTKYIGSPLVYKCNQNDIFCGYSGGVGKDGVRYEGWVKLLEDLNWHIRNDVWNYPKDVIERGGEIAIDAFN